MEKLLCVKISFFGICLFLQFIGTILIIFKYLKDVKEIGKENLAVPLIERLVVFFLGCPFWIFAFAILSM